MWYRHPEYSNLLFHRRNPENSFRKRSCLHATGLSPRLNDFLKANTLFLSQEWRTLEINFFLYPLSVSHLFTSTNWKKTYPVAQKYKYPYHLMQKYYSVHPVPSEKGEKRKRKRHGSEKEKFTFLQKGADFPPRCSYSGSTWNLSATSIIGSFLAIYHWVHFSRRVTSDHCLVWNMQNKEHFRPEALEKFNIPVCSARRVPSWVRCSLALLSTPCRTWEQIRLLESSKAIF